MFVAGCLLISGESVWEVLQLVDAPAITLSNFDVDSAVTAPPVRAGHCRNALPLPRQQRLDDSFEVVLPDLVPVHAQFNSLPVVIAESNHHVCACATSSCSIYVWRGSRLRQRLGTRRCVAWVELACGLSKVLRAFPSDAWVY